MVCEESTTRKSQRKSGLTPKSDAPLSVGSPKVTLLNNVTGALLSLSYASANRYEYDRMRVETDHYRVRPRRKRDGCNLESKRLSHGTLWYTKDADAISYAKWLSRVKGCKIEILDQAGNILRTEEFPPGNFAY